MIMRELTKREKRDLIKEGNKKGITKHKRHRENKKGCCFIPIEQTLGKPHYLYKTWTGMKTRCYSATNPRFHRYGGRGIRVCARWFYSFDNFVKDMGDRPEGYTLDRINNDGPYSPDNCRWANASTQTQNRGTPSGNTSGYKGVSWDTNSKKWVARVGVDGKRLHFGYYDCVHEAGEAARKGREKYHGKLRTIKEK